MPGVKVREGEPFEAALKRFKKQCEKAGILSELKKPGRDPRDTFEPGMTHRSLDPGHFEARRTRGPKGQRFTPPSRTASSDAPCVRNTATSCCDRVAPPIRSVWPTADAPGFPSTRPHEGGSISFGPATAQVRGRIR